MLYNIYVSQIKNLHIKFKISQSGAVVAREAHNLEVIGSNPVSVTKWTFISVG